MTSKFNTYLFLLLCAGLMLFSSSCQQDVEGCMDSTAENFNPDANVDDGNCVYARDKFIGTFMGTLACQAPLPNDESFTITFAEGLSDNSEVEISFENTETPLPVLTGTVDGNKITIAETETSIALDPSMPDVKTDLVYSGEAIIDDSGENLSGELRVEIVLFMQTLTCDMTAAKQ